MEGPRKGTQLDLKSGRSFFSEEVITKLRFKRPKERREGRKKRSKKEQKNVWRLTGDNMVERCSR